MGKTILTEKQRQLLLLFSAQPYIQEQFYLSDGTALAQYYLHHRLSEDLDFFSLREVSIKEIQATFTKIKRKIKFEKIVYRSSYNRNIFYLHWEDQIIKTEFTYYPFEQIEQPKIINNLKIDSLIDIAVNKTDTIITKARMRDFIDLFLILQKETWTFEMLRKNARIKFDMQVDALHIVAQLLEVSKLKDYPRMIIPFDIKLCEQFWINEAKKLEAEILQ